MFDAGCFRPHEIVVIDRLSAGPDTLGTTKIRNPTPGRDARAGEEQDPIGTVEIFGQIPHALTLPRAFEFWQPAIGRSVAA